MNKIAASVQHVSIFRIGNVYIIGVLYDFESENQEGTLDIIVKGNNISFGIDEPAGPRKAGTAIFSGSIHIVSEEKSIPVFNVNKANDISISIPVFSLGARDRQKLAYEITEVLSAVRQSLVVVPSGMSGIQGDADIELSAAREWGWNGW